MLSIEVLNISLSLPGTLFKQSIKKLIYVLKCKPPSESYLGAESFDPLFDASILSGADNGTMLALGVVEQCWCIITHWGCLYYIRVTIEIRLVFGAFVYYHLRHNQLTTSVYSQLDRLNLNQWQLSFISA